MAIATLRSSTTPQPVVSVRQAIERHASRLKEIAGWVRSQVSRRGRQPAFVEEVARKVFNDRSAAIEHVVTLVVDAARRGDLAEAESIGQHLIAIARCEHAAVRGAPPQLSVAEAHLLEERAEGLADEAEAAMAHDPCMRTWMRFLAADAELSAARRVLADAVRREVTRS